MHTVQDRDKWWALVNTVMEPRVPLNAGKFLIKCVTISFSRMNLLHGVNKKHVLFNCGMLFWYSSTLKISIHVDKTGSLTSFRWKLRNILVMTNPAYIISLFIIQASHVFVNFQDPVLYSVPHTKLTTATENKLTESSSPMTYPTRFIVHRIHT
jgi:hypothetical protein